MSCSCPSCRRPTRCRRFRLDPCGTCRAYWWGSCRGTRRPRLRGRTTRFRRDRASTEPYRGSSPRPGTAFQRTVCPPPPAPPVPELPPPPVPELPPAPPDPDPALPEAPPAPDAPPPDEPPFPAPPHRPPVPSCAARARRTCVSCAGRASRGTARAPALVEPELVAPPSPPEELELLEVEPVALVGSPLVDDVATRAPETVLPDTPEPPSFPPGLRRRRPSRPRPDTGGKNEREARTNSQRSAPQQKAQPSTYHACSRRGGGPSKTNRARVDYL